ncbi:thioredoxin family protein [Eudoraea sp.]|uniref:thioredoxin family protein n=1 Tax=Eudoraea sp. TaxID=1979955 RepID=UPI003C789419
MKNIDENIKEKALIAKALENAYEYKDYRILVDKLATEGKTTGTDQKISLVEYTQLNSRRMKRWDKTFRFSEDSLEELKKLHKPALWLVITESWCGDAAPSLPIMNKISQENNKINLKVVLRDENEELIKHFNTNGALSIPKLIMMDPTSLEVLNTWGPRPSTATQMAQEFKEAHGSLTADFKENLQQWYNKDKGQNISEDLINLLALE